MQPPGHPDEDSTFQRLQDLVERSAQLPPMRVRQDCFGEDWLLPRVFWEALAADRIEALVEPLERLLTAPFTAPYRNPAFAEQGHQLAEADEIDHRVLDRLGSVRSAAGRDA
jgi:hypothetical protein